MTVCLVVKENDEGKDDRTKVRCACASGGEPSLLFVHHCVRAGNSQAFRTCTVANSMGWVRCCVGRSWRVGHEVGDAAQAAHACAHGKCSAGGS